MILNSTQKIIFNVTIMLLVALAILFLVIFPTAKNIQKTAEETSKLRNYLEKQYQQTLNTRLTKQKIEQIKTESSSFSTYLFKPKDTLKLIQTLEAIANKNKMSQSIDSSDLDKISTAKKIKLSITASGNYDNALKYLYDLETMEYFLNPEQIKITPVYNRETGLPQQINLNLTIGLYVNN